MSLASLAIKRGYLDFTPPPDLTVSEWADRFRRLSSEASAEPGRWKTSRAQYQQGILDAINDPSVENIIVMSSAQVGKTEILLNAIGYFVDYDPAPILLLQPTLEMAQTFSKDRLAPMCRDTPALKDSIQDAKSRSSGNTMLHKTFPGGHITMAGANSPASLASRPIRILLADEVDRYPVSAGTEGDPVNLAKKRTTTFWNKKFVAVSTPTIKGASRIEDLYEDSTQERFELPCPACGEYHALKWSNIVFDVVGHTCESCGVVSSEDNWKKGHGRWKANANHHKTRGFHLNELVSPWRRWKDIIEDFVEAKKSPETLKTFINTSLGETWEADGEQVDDNALYARREHYSSEVPEKALFITCAIDVQSDRFELQWEAWGDQQENWKLRYQVLRGELNKTETWDRLDSALDKVFEHESGAILNTSAIAIDTGGLFTQATYDYVKRSRHYIYAIKGSSNRDANLVGTPSKNNLGGINLYTIGVHKLKHQIMHRTGIQKPGPAYIHFPISDEFELDYFQMYTAEKLMIKYVKGVRRDEWVKVRPRNEAFDLSCYNLAAYLIYQPDFAYLKSEIDKKVFNKNQAPKTKPQPQQSWINTSNDSWI